MASASLVAAPTERERWLYGRAVINGVPQFLSVSRITGADENTDGCLRAWNYEMVQGKKRPPTRASTCGVNLHGEIERYEKTGDRNLSSLALGGLHMVPEPGPDLLVEHNMVIRPGGLQPVNEAEAAALLANAPLTADGIPVLGRIDLIHARGTNKGGSSIEDTIDPPGTIEVMDWKSTGSPKYIKRQTELPRLIQMAGYGEWVYRVEPAADVVRLSHGYFVESGGPSRKVSLRVHREDISGTWEHAEAVARRIRHAAAESNPDLVDANTNACDKFGGCAHREYCKARMHMALSAFIGQTAASNLRTNRQETSTMGLLERIAASNAAPTTPTAAAPSAGIAGMIGLPSIPAPPPAVDPAIAQAAERARLEAEEVALRAATQARALADKVRPLYEKLVGYRDANPETLGLPSFSGEIAAALGTPQGITGSGPLGVKVVIANISDLETVAAQLDGLAASGAVKPIAQAPTSNAVMPRVGVGLLSPESPSPVNPPAPVVATVQAAPPPPAITVPASVAPQQAPASAPAAEAKPKSKKATPPKSDGTAFILFVDCDVEGADVTSFNPTFDALCAELVASTGDADVRCPLEKSPLAYGKWDGAVAAAFRERAPSFPAGMHSLRTRGNRAADVAADALREHAQKTGGFVVWGRR